MSQAKLHMLAIAAIAAASLALPLTSVAQTDQGNAPAGKPAAQTQKGNEPAGTSSTQTQNGDKTAAAMPAKHHKKSTHMSHAGTHKKKLYGSMRTPTNSQMKGTGAGMTGATSPNGPSATNPSGVK
jgi:hypothetical protein